ncbi:MAG: response regulator [Myxococcota bacterium]
MAVMDRVRTPGACVLVVEDEADVLKLTVHFLEHAGFIVDAVASGADALHALAAVRYDLLLCDKNLPGVHGLQVVEEARRLQPGIATVLMTAWPEIISMKDLDLDGYVTKPFRSGQDLADTLRGAIARRARRDEARAEAEDTSTSNPDLRPVVNQPKPTPQG